MEWFDNIFGTSTNTTTPQPQTTSGLFSWLNTLTSAAGSAYTATNNVSAQQQAANTLLAQQQAQAAQSSSVMKYVIIAVVAIGGILGLTLLFRRK